MFKKQLPAVEEFLEKSYFEGCWWIKLGRKAVIFGSSLNGGFYVTAENLVVIFKITKPLSVKLQGASQDLHYAIERVRDCVTVLNRMRAREPTLRKIFSKANIHIALSKFQESLQGNEIIQIFLPQHRSDFLRNYFNYLRSLSFKRYILPAIIYAKFCQKSLLKYMSSKRMLLFITWFPSTRFIFSVDSNRRAQNISAFR